MTKLGTITYGSHFFKITNITSTYRPILERFCQRYVQYGYRQEGRQQVYAALKVFAAARADRSEYRFHVNQLKDFWEIMTFNQITSEQFEQKYLPLPIVDTVKFVVQTHWKDREHQIPVIQYMTSPEPTLRKFVNLQTGSGKSYSTMRAMEDMGLRTLIVVRPMYIEKWYEDICRTYDILKNDIVCIQGAKQLLQLLNLAKEGPLPYKIIIISNKTLQFWIKEYERIGDETLEFGYPCLPEDLCSLLGVGLRVIDEVHQDFHLNFKIDLYTNIARSISLSATLIGDDDFINRMYAIGYPHAERCEEISYNKYVDVKALLYSFNHPSKVRCKNHVTKTYSHNLFEQSVMKQPDVCINYLKLIAETIDEYYIKVKKDGEKVIVFAASIDFCTLTTKYLAAKYPHLKVGRYVEDDEYSIIGESDIIVSTIQSAGTALDIPNLITVVLTTNVNSSQSNLQTIGRLRKLPNSATTFIYFCCEDIPKHLEYHNKKIQILSEKVISYRTIKFGKFI